MNKWLEITLRRLLPQYCLLCDAPGVRGLALCADCLADLPWNGPACRLCALPLPVEGVCPECQRNPPPMQGSHSLLVYRTPARELVLSLKFHQRLVAAELLGKLLAGSLLERVTHKPDLLVPVPLHPARLRQRGFNQALEIARPVARKLDLRLDPQCCIRERNTPAQSKLEHAGHRRRNVRGAFRVSRPLDGMQVAIVDDVVTTGATVREMAVTLQRAGAVRVDIWSCCRAATGSE